MAQRMEGTLSRSTDTRVAVVTGGNKGIGFEVCQQLAGNGITVVLTARDEQRGAEAVDKLTGLGLPEIIFHQLDITDASSIARLAKFLKSRFGRLDILVNNAAFGGGEPVGNPSFNPELTSMDPAQRIEWVRQNARETYDAAVKCLQTNYYGAKHVTEALLPLLQSSSDGRVVNVSSGFGLLRFIQNEELKQELNNPENITEERLDEVLAAFLKDFEAGVIEVRGWPKDFSAYKVAKVILNAYTRIFARQHPELRVNCVDPGYVNTDINFNSGYLTPEEGGNRVSSVALLPAGGPTGVLFADGKEALSFI